ncbi:alpha/beta fold hydrolase [Agilicoccus flavus]|uniref:alpha/beta fold hydrolase n=1 Tax=Agilicoccus flavus TaxID=2775968 RepID=UPI001CF6D69A|nr:alpha/beta hydrolase [Agilicoccus flavus]
MTHDTLATRTGEATSPDGTTIAWTSQGRGPALVVVNCVLVSRRTTMQPTLPRALAEYFTVVTYDRRGKGDSGNVGPYALEREIEDLEAVIAAAGGEADVYGFSSGGTLALLAAASQSASASAGAIRRVAVLEPPLFAGSDRSHHDAVARLLATDPLAAQVYFTQEVVGVPAEVVAQMPPLGDEDRRALPTLLHELSFLPGTPPERFAAATAPTLVMVSDHTDPRMGEFAAQLADAMPDCRVATLPGQWHGVDDATLTAAMVEFLQP